MPAETPSSSISNGVVNNDQPKKTGGYSASTLKSSATLDNMDAVHRIGKPDKVAYNAEQDSIQKEIDALRVRLNSLQGSINSGNSADNERRLELRAEWDKIRLEQSQSKATRGKLLDQLKSANDGIQKKVKDLQASKAKTPFKTVAEIDAHINQLEKRVESGSLTLADEKRALQEISQCRRSRKTVEHFEADQEAIERERAAVEEIRKQLDDPGLKAISDRADAIKAELDKLKKDDDELYNSRNKLFQERNELRTQMDNLYDKKKKSIQEYKDDNDKYWSKITEDRARRAEKLRAQRLAEEEQRKKDITQQLREEAEIPAFQIQIEDCQTLIDYFSGNANSAPTTSTPNPFAKTEVAGIPKLDIRKVSDNPGESLVVRKKKGDEEAYFVAGKKNKSGKGIPKVTDLSATSQGESTNASPQQFNVSLPILTALLSLSIPPPSSKADIPRTVSDLQTKKAWYEANQARVTQENISKAEANIQKVLGGGKVNNLSPPNGGGERPPEPAPTPVVVGDLSTGVSSEEIKEKLEDTQKLM